MRVSETFRPRASDRDVPSWSRIGTPRRPCPRARTPTRPPRGPPRCGPWTPQPRSRRARDPSRRHAVPAERRRATPRRIPPRRLTPRRTKWRDLGTQQVCQERNEKKDCVDHSACGVLQPRPRSPVKKKAVAKNGTIRSCRCGTTITSPHYQMQHLRAKNRHRKNGDHRLKTQSEKTENRKKILPFAYEDKRVHDHNLHARITVRPPPPDAGASETRPPSCARARANGTPVRSGRARARRAPVSARPNRIARPKRPIRFESRNHR